MTEVLDIILLGANGFTGRNVLPYLHELTLMSNLTWGVAGIRQKEIQDLLDSLAEKTGDETISRKQVIEVDLTDIQAIRKMTSKTRVVMNCCGPYMLLAENVVKCCVETGTHHIDVSGERLYMEKIHLLYNQKAREKGVYIINSCGFECVPQDLGAIFLQRHFQGTLNSIETYMKVNFDPAINQVNAASWTSIVNDVADISKMNLLKAHLFTSLPPLEPKLVKRIIPFQGEYDRKWAAPFPCPDHSVMLRTQRYLYEETKQRPAQIETYLLFENFISLIIIALTGLVFIILVRFEFGKYLLLKYPHIFSLGFIASTEPSEESIKKSKFSTTLIGKGWKDTVGADDVTKRAPNKGIVAQVKGTNPGYGTTAVCLVLAAIMILTEPSKLPKKGGVYSPGAAFAETSLIEQLHKNDVTFELIKEFDIVE